MTSSNFDWFIPQENIAIDRMVVRQLSLVPLRTDLFILDGRIR